MVIGLNLGLWLLVNCINLNQQPELILIQTITWITNVSKLIGLRLQSRFETNPKQNIGSGMAQVLTLQFMNGFWLETSDEKIINWFLDYKIMVRTMT